MSVKNIVCFFALVFVSCSKENRDPFFISFREESFTEAPVIAIELEGKLLPVKIDLGCAYQLMLKENTIEKISNKQLVDQCKGSDFSGYIYEHPRYKVPSFSIGQTVFKGVLAITEPDLFVKKGSKPFGSNSRKMEQELKFIEGRIGTEFFEPFICFFDFSRKLFWVGSNLEELRGHVAFEREATTSFRLQKGLIYLDIQTEEGEKNFVLDTGSSHTILNRRSFQGNRTKKLQWLQLGTLTIHKLAGPLLEFPPVLEQVDGILGIDFLKKYVLCLDFPRRELYLAPH